MYCALSALSKITNNFIGAPENFNFWGEPASPSTFCQAALELVYEEIAAMASARAEACKPLNNTCASL